MTIHTDKIKELQVQKNEFWRMMLASERHEDFHRRQARKWLNRWMDKDIQQVPLIRQELEDHA